MSWNSELFAAWLETLTVRGFDDQVLFILQDFYRIGNFWKGESAASRWIGCHRFVTQIKGHSV